MKKTKNNFFDNAQEHLNALAEQAKMLEAEREEHKNDYFRYLDYLRERDVTEHE